MAKPIKGKDGTQYKFFSKEEIARGDAPDSGEFMEFETEEDAIKFLEKLMESPDAREELTRIYLKSMMH